MQTHNRIHFNHVVSMSLVFMGWKGVKSYWLDWKRVCEHKHMHICTHFIHVCHTCKVHAASMLTYSIYYKTTETEVPFQEKPFFTGDHIKHMSNRVKMWTSWHENKCMYFYCVDIIENMALLLGMLPSSILFSLYNVHFRTKCLSSKHDISFCGVVGFMCLPRSISRGAKLDGTSISKN